ncbi:hypothetical protein [Vibrio sinaloensis]|uniref:hypothetical protein n=1 Tax=Photobacterium sp. (strain ATCC 43367) TaxID=379097 RepID=UPI0020605EB5|nr:hypothetical protein [Vibrio sinaloensis]UPQ89392.1 hypothetical protein MTO69_16645 [Vibrio sinaloensis]
MRANKIALALGLTGALLLVGCDSGGDSPSSTGSTTATPYSVKAIDGYLRNAKVWLDINRDFLHDEDSEPSAITGEGGVALLDVSAIPDYQNYPIVVHAIAGETIDEDTIDSTNPSGQVMQGSMVLSAPAGEANVTPLSSMVNLLMNKNPDALSDPAQIKQLKQQATLEAANLLGLDPDTLFDDYLDPATRSPKSTFAAQNLVKSQQVLPATPEQMLNLVQDVQNAGANASQSVPQLMVAEAVSDKIKQVLDNTAEDQLANTPAPVTPPSDQNASVDSDGDGVPDTLDAFPNESDEWLDSDDDGVGNNQDAFAFNPNETSDFDSDGVGDNADLDDDNDGYLDDNDSEDFNPNIAGDHDGDGYDSIIDLFPDDIAEWADSDGDQVGDNADPFDDDPTEWADTDNDNVGDNSDAYPDDSTKSVADSHQSNDVRRAVLNINHRHPMLLNIAVSKRVEQLNDGSVRTTLTHLYTDEDNDIYGETESRELALAGSFTRVHEFSFDFNLDGNAQFNGQLLDIGSRSPNGDSETFWRYVDESDATPEGGVNGDTPRQNDHLDFSIRQHPSDLTAIDTIQHFTVDIADSNNQQVVTTTMKQYVVQGFDVDSGVAQPQDYISYNRTVWQDLIAVEVEDKQDWQADGTINTVLSLINNQEGSYQYGFARPIWANPQDGIHEEYADFNYTAGNWDNLTSYWYDYSVLTRADGSQQQFGQRFVLADNDTKLVDVQSPQGYRFHWWQMDSRDVSDNERNEYVTWAHLALDGYDFTAASDNIGQAYRIYSRQQDDIWTTLSFDEWGSTDVVNLAERIEAARSGGTWMYDIDGSIIPGLDRYAASLPNETFQYLADGSPRQWYAVTQDPRLTDGTPTVVPLTLTQDGVLPDSYVVSNGPDLILTAPIDSNNIKPEASAYYRQRIDMYGLDMDPQRFSWTTNLGQLFTDQQVAEQRLHQVLNPSYRICEWQNSLRQGEVDAYGDYLAAAYRCGYIGIDSSYLEGLTLHYRESDTFWLSYQFLANGTGDYYESNGYRDSFSWTIDSNGIVSINNGGDQEYFAYIAQQGGKFSLLGFFKWQDNGVEHSEISGMELTTYAPNVLMASSCDLANTPWDDANDKPESYATTQDYRDALASCYLQIGDGSKLTADLMAGINPNVRGNWLVGHYAEVNGEQTFVEEEKVYFKPNGEGAFVDAEDGEFGFTWYVVDGRLTIDVTHPAYTGSYELNELINSGSSDLSFKTFWYDTTWSDVSPGQGEILDQIYRFDGYR